MDKALIELAEELANNLGEVDKNVLYIKLQEIAIDIRKEKAERMLSAEKREEEILSAYPSLFN